MLNLKEGKIVTSRWEAKTPPLLSFIVSKDWSKSILLFQRLSVGAICSAPPFSVRADDAQELTPPLLSNRK